MVFPRHVGPRLLSDCNTSADLDDFVDPSRFGARFFADAEDSWKTVGVDGYLDRCVGARSPGANFDYSVGWYGERPDPKAELRR